MELPNIMAPLALKGGGEIRRLVHSRERTTTLSGRAVVTDRGSVVVF